MTKTKLYFCQKTKTKPKVAVKMNKLCVTPVLEFHLLFYLPLMKSRKNANSTGRRGQLTSSASGFGEDFTDPLDTGV